MPNARTDTVELLDALTDLLLRWSYEGTTGAERIVRDIAPGSHGLRGIESWIGGHPVRGVASLADMLALLAAIGIGMLIGAAAVRRPLAAGT